MTITPGRLTAAAAAAATLETVVGRPRTQTFVRNLRLRGLEASMTIGHPTAWDTQYRIMISGGGVASSHSHFSRPGQMTLGELLADFGIRSNEK